MKEQFEINAIRLAHLILGKAHKGQLQKARRIAREIVKADELPPEPAPVEPHRSEPRKEPIACHIRWLIRRDMPEVLEIESESSRYPWNEDEFIRLLRQRNCIGMVAEHDEQVVGFMIYELHKARLHLLTLAVGERWRRQAVCRSLIDKLKVKLHPDRRQRIIYEVRESDTDRQQALASCGWVAVQVLTEWFDDTAEDAYLFQYHLPGSSSNPPALARPKSEWRDSDGENEQFA